MDGVKDTVYKPIPENAEIYAKIYKLYKQVHDAFGVEGTSEPLANVMKELLEIKDAVNKSGV
jgi:L-ribulokinase